MNMGMVIEALILQTSEWSQILRGQALQNTSPVVAFLTTGGF